jgi:NAD(P)-dependent dehydrogenase (short-subunit alcohol dehydrogenase family)
MSMANGANIVVPGPNFPTRNEPRVWFVTSGDSSLGIALAKQVLDHGDYVVAGINAAEFETDGGRSQSFKAFLADVGRSNGWRERLKIVELDVRSVIPLALREGADQDAESWVSVRQP